MKCDFMGRKRLRYHFHCLSDFVYRYKCHQSSQNVDLEEEFLHAAEFGDIPSVKRILDQTPEMNVDCIDALGRTALRLAVKNEHLEVKKTINDDMNDILVKIPNTIINKKITAIKVLSRYCAIYVWEDNGRLDFEIFMNSSNEFDEFGTDKIFQNA